MKKRGAEEIFPVIYAVLLVVAIVFLVYVAKTFKIDFFMSTSYEPAQLYTDWKITDEEGNALGTYDAFQGVERNTTVIMETTLPEDLEYNSALEFYSVHTDVVVYADGELIYQYKRSGENAFGHSTGYQINVLQKIYEYRGKNLTVELTSAYQMSALPEFYVGSTYSIYKQELIKGAFSFMISFITLTVGLVLCATWVCFRRKLAVTFLYLGLFSINVAIYNINEQQLAHFLEGQNLYPVYLAHLALMFMPIPFVYFLRGLYHNAKDKLWYVFLGISYANIIGSLILQIFDVADLHDLLICSHLVFAIMFIILIVQTIREMKKCKLSKTMRLNIVCILVLIICLLVDLVRYYQTGGKSVGYFSNVAFLLYILVVGINAINENRELLEKGRNAQRYEQLAYTDKLTGLANRLAHDKALEEADVTKHNYMVCMFDLNNLKRCNDTLGHNAGDEYIKSSANVLQESFGRMAGRDIFRIGGDEFCIILRDSSVAEYNKAIEHMEKLCRQYNEKAALVQMHIAYGYAVYDKHQDVSLTETRSRADSMMYERKFRMKQEQKGNNPAFAEDDR